MPRPATTMNSPAEDLRGRWQVIPATLLVALFLNAMPYPEWAKFARPDWVTLVLFYWCLAVPRRVGVGCGWIMGLLLDLMQYTLFGQQAIGKALVAMVAVSAHQRLRLYHAGRQCAVILVLASIEIAVVVWVYYLTHDVAWRLVYWQGAVTTALLWPLVYVFLRKLRRHSGIVRR